MVNYDPIKWADNSRHFYTVIIMPPEPDKSAIIQEILGPDLLNVPESSLQKKQDELAKHTPAYLQAYRDKIQQSQKAGFLPAEGEPDPNNYRSESMAMADQAGRAADARSPTATKQNLIQQIVGPELLNIPAKDQAAKRAELGTQTQTYLTAYRDRLQEAKDTRDADGNNHLPAAGTERDTSIALAEQAGTAADARSQETERPPSTQPAPDTDPGPAVHNSQSPTAKTDPGGQGGQTAANQRARQEADTSLNGNGTAGFASGSAVLTKAQEKYWSEFAQKYKDSGSKQPILLNGYADATGSRKGNLALGQKRAEAVQQYLATQDVKANVETGSGGQSHPTDPNNKSNDADRRVTAYVGADNINAVREENKKEAVAAIGQEATRAANRAKMHGRRRDNLHNMGYNGEDGPNTPAAAHPAVTTQSAPTQPGLQAGAQASVVIPQVGFNVMADRHTVQKLANGNYRYIIDGTHHMDREMTPDNLTTYLRSNGATGGGGEQIRNLTQQIGGQVAEAVDQAIGGTWGHTVPQKASTPAAAPTQQGPVTATPLAPPPKVKPRVMVTPTANMPLGGAPY